MKILFLFHGTTHYFNLITSQINNTEGVEILYIYPKKVSNLMGEGVFQTIEGANFKFIELEEKTNQTNNYPYFIELEQFIIENKPNVILCADIYLKSLFFDESLKKLLNKLNIKIILKSIPFQIRKQQEYIDEFKNNIKKNPAPPFNSLPTQLRKILKFCKFDLFYKYAYLDRKLQRLFKRNLKARKALYNFPDAHVNYVEEAYAIYGSYGVSPEKIFITYNSPDTDFLFSIRGKIKSATPLLPYNKFRIIHLSRLVKWKRVDMLIEAVKNLKNEFPEIELLVVGEGPEKENLQEQAKLSNVTDSVIFLGGIYDPEILGKYLQASSIYVLAGMGGLSINDAMIFGLPVICSVCDGTEKHLVKEGYNGLFFENGNQISLESKIRQLLKDEPLRKTMGINSTQIIKDEINIHTVVDGYNRAFNYVVSK